MKEMRRSFVLLLVPALFMFLPGCGKKASESHSGAGVEHQEEGHSGTVHLTAATQQALGITVVPATIQPLEQTLELTGQIAQDTDRFLYVHPPHAGTVSQLNVTVGDRVSKGDLLAVIDSTETNSPLDVVAPGSGMVIGIHVKPSAAVDHLSSLMTIADLSQVWATFDLYEQDAGVVQVGQRIEAYSIAYPDRPFPGKVIFISPQVDQHTRTIKVRAQLENPDYALKLGMFVKGALYIPVAEETLVVPHAAIQRMGEESVVFVQTGPEEFRVREVRVGRQTRTGVQITEGLQSGESVVAEGSFHLKAELLKGTLEEEHAH